MMGEDGYYAQKLAAERLRRCYAIAPPRVRRYLDAEIEFVRTHCRSDDSVLELGCGYGRVLESLTGTVRRLVGIDSSLQSLSLADPTGPEEARFGLVAMDAACLGFCDAAFDVVVCIQNGISAFAVDPALLIHEAVRVARRGATVLFSSYAACFWPERLEWFRRQAAEGLLGEIDESATGDGVIVCRDGFRATTFDPERFRALTTGLDAQVEIVEVDRSSLFCVISVP